MKNNCECIWVCSDYGIAFNGKGEWNFGNDFARNVIIFGVDSSSSSHTDNRKIKLLILGEWNTFGLNGSFGAPEKKFSINFIKEKTNFSLSLNHSHNNIYLLVNGKENLLI